MRHPAWASALAVLALAASPLPAGSLLPSGTAFAMGGRPSGSADRQPRAGELGGVAEAPGFGSMGMGMAEGQTGGAAKAPSGSGVFGDAFSLMAAGLAARARMPAWMRSLDSSAMGGSMGASMGGEPLPSSLSAAPLPQTGGEAKLSDSDVVGTWSAPNGISPLTVQIRPGGACSLFDKGQKIAGSWKAAGDQLSLRFVNGRAFALAFSVEGGRLVLSDGSCLERRTDAGAQAPQASTDPRDLIGSWQAWDSGCAAVLAFAPGTCTLNANARLYKGSWRASEGWLHVEFEGAPPLDAAFSVEDGILRLSDGTILLRQQP